MFFILQSLLELIDFLLQCLDLAHHALAHLLVRIRQHVVIEIDVELFLDICDVVI